MLQESASSALEIISWENQQISKKLPHEVHMDTIFRAPTENNSISQIYAKGLYFV